MNILFIAPDFPDEGLPRTGFPNYLYRVSMALVNMGHNPIILITGNRNEVHCEKGIKFIWVRFVSKGYSNLCLNYVENAFGKSYIVNEKIKELASKIEIDIIQFTSLNGISILYDGGIPSVLRLSSYAKTAFGTFQTYSKQYVDIMSIIERQASRHCDAVFSPCNNNAVAYGRDVNRKVYTIETPFVEDVTEYDTYYVDTYLKDKRYVLYFGSLYIEKGIKVIGQCLEKFLSENKDYYFVFVGHHGIIDGEKASAYLKRCALDRADRILIFPELGHNQLYPIIKESDFVVLPSLMENLSNACIEAMYFGKVVIGTDGASYEQLITHNESGLLCKIGDSDDLLDKMTIAVSLDENEKNRIGLNAKKRIDRLKPEIAVKRLVEFYNRVIEKSNKNKRVSTFKNKIIWKPKNKKLDKAWDEADKYHLLYNMMSQWVKIKLENRSLAEYLEKMGYKRIAIYGMNQIGEDLLHELKDTNITVAYGIDRRAGNLYSSVNIVSSEETLEAVDAIIVTAISYFEEIEGMLSQKVDCPILSLNDIMYEI